MSKKHFLWIFVIAVILYFASVYLRAYRWEKETEEYMEAAIFDVAKPWDCEKLEGRASWWLREKSKLIPCEIVDMSKNDFGNLIELAGPTKCNIQQGHDKYSREKHSYAICVATLRMDKKSVVMEIRLVQENSDWKINDFISVN